jgi:hypothetical protein
MPAGRPTFGSHRERHSAEYQIERRFLVRSESDVEHDRIRRRHEKFSTRLDRLYMLRAE